MTRSSSTYRIPASDVPDQPHRLVPSDRLGELMGVTAQNRLTGKLGELQKLLIFPEGTSAEEVRFKVVRAAEFYESLKPADGVEEMLVQQMVGTHFAALECLRRAALNGQTEDGRDMNLKHAAKLEALFTKQTAALDKRRGKGQQKVTVEHVNVAAGGKAIVGSVERGDGRSSAVTQSADNGRAADAPSPAAIGHDRGVTIDARWMSDEPQKVPVSAGDRSLDKSAPRARGQDDRLYDADQPSGPSKPKAPDHTQAPSKEQRPDEKAGKGRKAMDGDGTGNRKAKKKPKRTVGPWPTARLDQWPGDRCLASSFCKDGGSCADRRQRAFGTSGALSIVPDEFRIVAIGRACDPALSGHRRGAGLEIVHRMVHFMREGG